jgi:hypothetical protein
MGFRMWPRILPTIGERNLALAYVSVGLSGAFLALYAVMQLGQGALLLRALTRYEIWTCMAGAVGAVLALYIMQRHFGMPGWRGWLRAVCGMIMLCFVGSLITGTIALPLYGTMFGPFTLTMILAGSPLLAVMWGMTLCGVHLLLTTWRTERDSIFTTQRRAPGLRQAPGLHINPRP